MSTKTKRTYNISQEAIATVKRLVEERHLAPSQNTHIAMLRGINVSGQNKIKMDDLRALMVRLGLTDVSTYIQSGNVIFTSPVNSSSDLAGDIEQRIAADLGLRVTVLLRAQDELANIIETNPFLPQGSDPAHLHVTFLTNPADRALLDRLDVPNTAPDEYRVRGHEIFLHCPRGYGRTKLNNAFWERRLRVAATTRNWNTVSKLLTLAGD